MAWLRRTYQFPVSTCGQDHTYTIADMQFDPDRRLLRSANGDITRLSRMESRLLTLLVERAGEVMEPDLVSECMWAEERETGFALLRNLVYRLRKKIEPYPEHPQYLVTIPGHGYRLAAPGT
jgi:DNA-binding response OmpR family regulator